MNVEDMGRNSIQLYELRGLRLDHQDIIDKFKQFSDHEWPIKLRGDKPCVLSAKQGLYCSIPGMKLILDSQKQTDFF